MITFIFNLYNFKYLQGWGVGAGAPYPNIFCVRIAECWKGGK